MARRGDAIFVGFGFGPIQAGLFCYEAKQSGAFRHLVVAEIVPEVVAEIRATGGLYKLNLAHLDHIEVVTVGPIQIEDPSQYADRARLIEAIAAAQEIATAVPNVRAYRRSGQSNQQSSLHRILAQGLQRKVAVAGPVATVYCAENHPRAADLLRAAVMEEVPEAEHAEVGHYASFVNTVIPKMSGVMTPADDLAPLTPTSKRAFLVEPFNKIMVSQSDFAESGATFATGLPGSFTTGFPTFVVKEDLTPFDDAKFLGHNGIHTLGGYLGMAAGLTYISEWASTSRIKAAGMMDFLRAAFIDEVGAGLIHRYAGMDALFTPTGFTAFADDLLVRTVNPYLRDTTERLCRDPERKLGWDDRLIGAMRVTHAAGIVPWRFAMGAAAALQALDPDADPAVLLPALWRQAAPAKDEARDEIGAMLALVQQGVQRFKAWQQAGFPNLEEQF